MVEAILLQIPPPVREVLQVCTANHCNCVVDVEQVLLHHLILLLLDLIQGPYHGIIVMLVAECLLHVHQQVPHGDILAFIQHAGPFAGVPTETGKNVGAHACLIILLQEGVHIEVPECVHHLHSWVGQLKDWHIQAHRCQPLLLPTPSVAPASMPAACDLTHSGVPIRVQCPSVQRGERQTPSTHCSALGLRWPSVWSHSPCMGGEPSLRHLIHPGGSPSLLWCTTHQLARGVRLHCIHNWNIMDWVLSPAPQPSTVRGSNCSPPHLHQREEANGEVDRA